MMITHFAQAASKKNMASTTIAAANRKRQKHNFILTSPSGKNFPYLIKKKRAFQVLIFIILSCKILSPSLTKIMMASTRKAVLYPEMSGIFILPKVKMTRRRASTPSPIPMILIGLVQYCEFVQPNIMALWELPLTQRKIPKTARLIKFALSPDPNGALIPVKTATTKRAIKSPRTDDKTVFHLAVKKVSLILNHLAAFLPISNFKRL